MTTEPTEPAAETASADGTINMRHVPGKVRPATKEETVARLQSLPADQFATVQDSMHRKWLCDYLPDLQKLARHKRDAEGLDVGALGGLILQVGHPLSDVASEETKAAWAEAMKDDPNKLLMDMRMVYLEQFAGILERVEENATRKHLYAGAAPALRAVPAGHTAVIVAATNNLSYGVTVYHVANLLDGDPAELLAALRATEAPAVVKW